MEGNEVASDKNARPQAGSLQDDVVKAATDPHEWGPVRCGTLPFFYNVFEGTLVRSGSRGLRLDQDVDEELYRNVLDCAAHVHPEACVYEHKYDYQ